MNLSLTTRFIDDFGDYVIFAIAMVVAVLIIMFCVLLIVMIVGIADETIGYKQKSTSLYTLEYYGRYSIYFNFPDHDISIFDCECIDMPLLKAINKQIEELGWNND